MGYRQVWSTGLKAAAAATGSNLLVFVLTRSADVALAVEPGDTVAPVSAGSVIAATILAILVGTLAAALAGAGLRRVQIAAVAVAAISLGGPLSMGVGAAPRRDRSPQCTLSPRPPS